MSKYSNDFGISVLLNKPFKFMIIKIIIIINLNYSTIKSIS